MADDKKMKSKRLSKPKAILFDVDGTILPFDGVIKHLQKTCRHFGVRVLTKNEILKKTIGYTIEESIPKLNPETKNFIKDFADYYREQYNKDAKSIMPFPYVKSVLENIWDRKIKIGIVTTKSKGQAIITMRYYSLPHNVILGHDDVKNRKPNPEAILKACKILGVKPRECIFVGDHPFDMEAATRAGCLPIGVLAGWGNKKNLKEAGAAYIIKDLRGLIKLLETGD